MGVYRYDIDDLHRTASGLQTLRADFEQASRAREHASGAFGYADLSGAVEQFVDNWKHNREKQIEAIGGAAEALTTITENYVEQDAAGAQAVGSLGE